MCEWGKKERGEKGGRNMWTDKRVWRDKKIHIIERMMMCTYKYMSEREGRERERGGLMDTSVI